jgi:hypothetical protein
VNQTEDGNLFGVGTYYEDAWLTVFHITAPGEGWFRRGIYINDTANTQMTIGLTINQGGNDDEILAFKSSDVVHTATNVTEEDTYGYFSKISAGTGGLFMVGVSEGAPNKGIEMVGLVTTNITAKDGNADGCVNIRGGKITGGSIGSNDANANLLTIQDSAATRWIINAEGDVWQTGGIDLGGAAVGQLDETIPEVIQQDGEPGTTYPGLIWVDTDADPAGTNTTSLIQDNDQDTKIQCEESADEDIVRIDAGGTEIWKGLSTGEITSPLQPAFLIELDGDQENLGKNVEIQFDNIIFDIGDNYDTDLYRFTAPVTGKYLIQCHIKLHQIDRTPDNCYIRIDTSNRNYYVQMDPDIFDIDPPIWSWMLGIVADMDEDDFVYVAWSYAGAGAEMTDVIGGGSYTHFMGHLLS